MPAQQVELAPAYRYYTADLLTNEIISEIPFRGVSWGRALKGAGAFSGKIPVIEATKSLGLYENTMPGKTALFVVRNGICVWGGIIWSREYDVVSKDLSVSASEFTSYFHHRKIWKTWNHAFGATLEITGGTGKVTFDYGSTTPVFPGSSIQIEFDEPEDYRYDGHYRVAGSPPPTLAGFNIIDGNSVADILSVEVISGIAYITTVGHHKFNTDDVVTIASSEGAPFDGSFQISLVQGASSDLFTYPVSSGDVPRKSASGTAARPTPEGVYPRTTVTVRLDTYDYVRNLIDSVFSDFVGTQFPNTYIEPGINYQLDAVKKELSLGAATITTDVDHGLTVGQAVVIRDVGPQFDGEHEVLATPAKNEIMYSAGGDMVNTPIAPNFEVITRVGLANQVATITTNTPHGFIVGNSVAVFVGYELSDFNGKQRIKKVLSPSIFQYDVYSYNTIQEHTLANAIVTSLSGDFGIQAASISGNVATLTTDAVHPYTVGTSITVANTVRKFQIVEKALDAPNSLATVKTSVPHGFQTGQSVELAGLKDTSTVTDRQTTTSSATFTTKQMHNFKVGDPLTISDMVDSYAIVSKKITSNVASLTTDYTHNMFSGDTLQVSGLVDSYAVTKKALLEGVATLTTSATHNVSVNETVVITGLSDSSTVSSLSAQDGIGILTLSAPHNFLEEQEITVSGVGAPFDGTVTVLSTTATRILFQIDNNDATILPSRSSGTVSSPESYFNGEYTVSDVSSKTISYIRVGYNITSRADAGTVFVDSILNGTFTVTASTSTTVEYSRTANNMPAVVVSPPIEEEIPPAVVGVYGVFSGVYTVSNITRNTFTIPRAGLRAKSSKVPASGLVSVESIFNGFRSITAVTSDTFSFTMTAISNQLENSPLMQATVSEHGLFDGDYTVSAVGVGGRTFSYVLPWDDLPEAPVQTYGSAVVSPVAVVGTYGPYPGNSDIGVQFSSKRYSGINVTPMSYRGFELKTVGEALDSYSDSIDGFEYRIDCTYDPELDQFIKTFVLLPIDFPNAPPVGEISPIERFGAEKLVFEYPGGSISSMTVSESAEDSATRFFAVGESDLGPDVGPNMSIASADDLLSGTNGMDEYRRWPLLDAVQKIDDVDDEQVLYAYARRYLAESKPPGADLSVTVNGSISPFVGTYFPGDWCSLIIDDDFAKMRLKSDLEPRDDVLVRKIDQFEVSVPDSVTFPEMVSLSLIPEWEVDKRGKSSI